MVKEVKQGVLCEVVGGALHPPVNAGKIVKVASYQGEHSLHGPIWRCSGDGLVTEYGVKAIAMDFAEDWLRPLPDEELGNQMSVEDLLVA